MAIFTDFDKRMKGYEKAHTDIRLIPRCPVILRLDGKSFHTYTKPFKDKSNPDPFSDYLHYAFVESSKYLASKVSGCRAIYTQSDEVSMYITDEGKSIDSQGWFNFELQKMVSISSSLFTAKFNQVIQEIRPDITEFAIFDARAFSLPNDIELNNNLVWRQKDASRNSVSMLAQHLFSHKSLQKLSCNQMQEKLFSEKGINWNNIETWKKRGSLVVKRDFVKDVEYERDGCIVVQKNVVRKKWVEVDCPLFTKESVVELSK
jgi:tRNA(His) guanylyltransferase